MGIVFLLRSPIMSFLDELSPGHMSLFESAAEVLLLDPGHLLIRRGDAGGDLYLLRQGTLEIVDTRSMPETITAVLTDGALVGDMAFLDDAPRSANVRASTASKVLHWAREDINTLLAKNSELASNFYKHIATTATQRMRSLTSAAITGGLSNSSTGRFILETALATDAAKTIADNFKEMLMSAEQKLALDPADPTANTTIRHTLDKLEKDLTALASAFTEPHDIVAINRTLARDLRPHLVRSALARKCVSRPDSGAGSPEILAHVFEGVAVGDDNFGTLLDRWLLDRPTLTALRGLNEALMVEFQLALAASRPAEDNEPRRVMVINVGGGSLMSSIIHAVADQETVITAVDSSRDALVFLDMGLTARPKSVSLVPIQENIAQLAAGRINHTIEKQDIIVIPNIVEYLPDRIAVSLLQTTSRLLSDNGVIINNALTPSGDSSLIDLLLRWPTIRRSPKGIMRLFSAANMSVQIAKDAIKPTIVTLAKHIEG